MKRLPIALALLAALALAGVWYFHAATSDGKRDGDAHHRGGRDEPRTVPVAVARALRTDIHRSLTAPGTATAPSNIVVQSRVDGQLLSLAFREGENVKAGQVLAEIDPRPFEAALHQAEAARARDQALLDNARRDLAHDTELLAQDAVSQQQVDTQAALVRQIEASVAGDEAALALARTQLSYCTIRAPVDGQAGLRHVDPGALVRAADTAGIVTIATRQPVDVLFSLPGDQLPAVAARWRDAPPPRVTATRRAADNTQDDPAPEDGVLVAVDNQVDAATGSFRLRARFDNRDLTLYPGQFVAVRVETGVDAQVLAVPERAVQRGRDGAYVYVVDPAALTVSLRRVTTGAREDDRIAVTDGLALRDLVVVDGLDALKDGSRVEIPAGTPP